MQRTGRAATSYNLLSLPSIYELKPRFQAVLRPAMRAIHRAGVTPNGVTLLAIAGSIGAGWALGYADERRALLLVLPIWLFIRMALNAIDGMMARELDLKSSFGAVLNELGDVISDLALYLPLAVLERRATGSVLAFAIGGMLTEFCGVLGQALGASRHYQGPMGKSDRAFIAGLVALLTYFFPHLFDHWWWIFGAAAMLTAFTCANRIRAALAEIRSAT
jgi:phosphatidylglycerophosphate synthase